MPAFNTPSGFPVTNTNIRTRIPVEDPNNVVSTAEVAGIQLELRYLSHLTQNYDYWDKAENAYVHQGPQERKRAFWTSFGVHRSKSEPVYREMYADAMTAIHNRLLQKGPENNLTYAVELIPAARRRGRVDWNPEQRQDHIACFMCGSLLLGATTSGASGPVVSVPPLDEGLTETARRDWETGLEFIDTCMDTYKRTATCRVSGVEVTAKLSIVETWIGTLRDHGPHNVRLLMMQDTNTFDYSELFDDYEQQLPIHQPPQYQIPDVLPVPRPPDFTVLPVLPFVSFPSDDSLPAAQTEQPALTQVNPDMEWSFLVEQFGDPFLNLLPNLDPDNDSLAPALISSSLCLGAVDPRLTSSTPSEDTKEVKSEIKSRLAAMKEEVRRLVAQIAEVGP
ncbi:hypothetical protein H0H93_004757 [Arthromyces matolae]|nr:hypothetical protein H0H93_004757 [Arthromyces matolae]